MADFAHLLVSKKRDRPATTASRSSCASRSVTFSKIRTSYSSRPHTWRPCPFCDFTQKLWQTFPTREQIAGLAHRRCKFRITVESLPAEATAPPPAPSDRVLSTAICGLLKYLSCILWKKDRAQSSMLMILIELFPQVSLDQQKCVNLADLETYTDRHRHRHRHRHVHIYTSIYDDQISPEFR